MVGFAWTRKKKGQLERGKDVSKGMATMAPPPLPLLPLLPSPCSPVLLFYPYETNPCKTQWLKTTSYYVSCLWLSWVPPDSSAPWSRGRSQDRLRLLDGLRWQVKEGSVHMSGALVPLPAAVPPVGPSQSMVVSGWPNCSQGCRLPRGRSRSCLYEILHLGVPSGHLHDILLF